MVNARQRTAQLHPRVAAALACGIFALILMALDTSGLVHAYGYIGMGNDWPSATRVLVTVATAATIGAILPGPSELPGGLVVWTLGILIAIPALVVTPRTNAHATTAALVPFVGFLALLVFFRLPIDLRVRTGLTRPAVLAFLATLSILAAAIVAVAYGVHASFTSLSDMYSVRNEFEQRSASGGPLAAYASGWLVNLLGPSLIGLGTLWRRRDAVAVGVACLTVHYLAVPSKLVVLLPVLSFGVSLMLRRGRRLPGPASVALAVSALIVTVWILFPKPGNQAFAILVFRFVHIPVFVDTQWVGYFVSHPKGNFAQQLPFVTNAYGGVTLPKLMAQIFGSGQGNNNAHLWADGYGNLGFVGVIIVSAIVGAALSLANSIARGRDFQAGLIIFLGPAISLLNNSAFTNLLTGGTALAIILIAMLPEVLDDSHLGGRTHGLGAAQSESAW